MLVAKILVTSIDYPNNSVGAVKDSEVGIIPRARVLLFITLSSDSHIYPTIIFPASGYS